MKTLIVPLLGLALLAFVWADAPESPPIETAAGWIKYPNNPVLGSGYAEHSAPAAPKPLFCPLFVGLFVAPIQKVCQNYDNGSWETSEINIMAKKLINKSALVRDYLAKYPEKGPSAIAQQIGQEHGVSMTGKFVTTVKTKLKQANGSAAAASTAPAATPRPSSAAAAKRKAAPTRAKSTPAKPAPAPASATALSHHIANLKAAALKLGKDEAKRIIDLF